MSRNLTGITVEFTIGAGKRSVTVVQKSWKMEIQKKITHNTDPKVTV